MKCPACGREMLNKGAFLDCPNILCDYDEDVEIRDIMRALFSGPALSPATTTQEKEVIKCY